MFQNGQTSVIDAEHSWHPSTSLSEGNTEQAHVIILNNRKVIVAHFDSDQLLKEAVCMWLGAQLRTFCSEGISKLVQYWTKCI
jgi:hypothetical protein